MTEQNNDVVVLSGTRTAIGRYGGSLAGVAPCDLAATVVREAVKRSTVDPEEFGHAVFGNVIHTQPRDMYLSRVAAVNGGLPVKVPAFTVNRLCGSGLQAIVSAAQLILLGDAEVAVAGGAESMSRGPYWLQDMRWGQRMGDTKAIDPVVGALNDPWNACHMGITAENVAEDYNISREDQDALAVESHRRAAAATAAHYFDEQITPIEITVKKKTVEFDDRRALPGRRQPGGHGPAAPGVRQGGHGDRRERLGHERRGGRGRAGQQRGTPAATACSRWAAWSPTATRASSPGSWASARCRPSGRCWRRPA